MKARIVQHIFGASGTGGPVAALERLLAYSKLTYTVIRQTSPANGISLRLIRRFVAEIREARPVLVHVRGLGNEGFHAALAARIAGAPNILVSVHGTHRDLQYVQSPFKHWIMVHLLERLTLMMATHIATVCEFAAKRPFLQPYQSKLVGVIPNGVEPLEQTFTSSQELRSIWNIPDGSRIGVMVARLVPEKGILVLADALARLDKKVADFTVILVGGGDENGHLKASFSTLKNISVVFAGQQKNVPQFLNAADFFLFPSLHENLSNALIEAMSHGLPAIATSVGGNVEVLEKEGGGILVPVGDAEALACAIQKMLDNPSLAAALGDKARETVRKHYSIEHMVAGWESVYRQIVLDK